MKVCPVVKQNCHYIDCAKSKRCFRQDTGGLKPPFKRMSKLEPTKFGKGAKWRKDRK